MQKTDKKIEEAKQDFEDRRNNGNTRKVGNSDYIEGKNCFKLKRKFNGKAVNVSSIKLNGVKLSLIHYLAINLDSFFFINAFTGSVIQIADEKVLRINSGNKSKLSDFAKRYFEMPENWDYGKTTKKA